MSPGITLQRLQKSQIRDLMKIDKQVYPEPWSRTLWTRELDRDQNTRVYLSATEGKSLVGYAGALRMTDETHVVTVAVDPTQQRRGIATMLFGALCRQAVAWDCVAITLEVRADNKPAQALYRRYGMAPVGIRKGYYKPDNHDALIMTADDIDQPAFMERLDRIDAAIGSTTPAHSPQASSLAAISGEAS